MICLWVKRVKAALRQGLWLVLCILLPVALAAQDIRDPRLDEALTLADEGRSADAIALTEETLAAAISEQDRW